MIGLLILSTLSFSSVLADASLCASFSDPVARGACERLSSSLTDGVASGLSLAKRQALAPGLSPVTIDPPGSEVLNSCAEVRAQNPAATDGTYGLTSNNIQTYCSGMASGNPKEYLSLSGDNYAEAVAYKNGVLSRMRTTYTKVLFNPRALVISIGGADNGRFASTTVDPASPGLPLVLPNNGVAAFNVSFASAIDCVDDDVSAVAKIDLRGSGLSLVNNFVSVGQMVVPDIDLDDCFDQQCATLTVKGNCGAVHPAPILTDGTKTLNPVNGRGVFQLPLTIRQTPAPTAAPTPTPTSTTTASTTTTTATTTTTTTTTAPSSTSTAATTSSTTASTTSGTTTSTTTTGTTTSTTTTPSPSTTTAPPPSPTIIPGYCEDEDAVGACCAHDLSDESTSCFVISCRFCRETMGSGVELLFAGQGSVCDDIANNATCALKQ
jgi:hypothetical protein